jgi:hypothetical protein
MGDEYDVNEYTDEQLFRILDVNNPTDRELEAKILSLVRKYSNFGSESGNKLYQFFIDIYNRFFENDENNIEQEDEKEGFETYNVDSTIVGNGRTFMPGNVTAENIFSESDLSKSGNGIIGLINMGNVLTPSEDNVKLTKQIDYSKDKLNPLLKQTVKRIISIDSQYRNQQTNSPSTNFTFDLSEPLKDVVSLSLYSIQIPYTWYTVNSDYGGNFIYLKGNAPGIIDGNHDYKIEILSGNYTPSELAKAVTKSIQTLASQNTDVDFGSTSLIYNNGITDPNSGTGKCALQIDIRKIYNEGNYFLNFPTWSSPIIDTSPNATNQVKTSTIPGYLGFDDKQYYCNSIYSSFFSTNYKNIINQIKTGITHFSVVPYVGSSYLLADIYYAPIKVSLNLNNSTQYSVLNIASLINDALIKDTTHFDNTDVNFTGCKIVDVSNSLLYGNGQSYIQLSCKLNNLYSPVVPNLKTAVVFPYDASGSLFYGTNSICKFNNYDPLLNSDSSGNIFFELNELISENPILESSYDCSNTSIVYFCDISGYSESTNNIVVNIPNSIYSLNSFITIVNNKIKNILDALPRLSSSVISFNSDVNNYLEFNSTINNIYTNNDYVIYIEQKPGNSNYTIYDMFGIPVAPGPTDSVAQNSLANDIWNNPSYSFPNSVTILETIHIVPKIGLNNNDNTTEFVIPFNITSGNPYAVRDDLTSALQTYQDPNTKLYPLSSSFVTYDPTTSFTLNLNINLHITQSFYKLKLNAVNGRDPSNVWQNLDFDESYNLIDFSSNIVKSLYPVTANTIKIDSSNNTFNILPSTAVNVFNTSNNYAVKITIPDPSGNGTNYGINELITSINTQLANTIANGTTFSTYYFKGQTFIKIRFNINQIFTTKDYKLVFYDPFSFTSCFTNNSNKTSTSIQNATWDSTLGWLLGYRSETFYSLGDYVGVTYNPNLPNPSGTISPNLYYLPEPSSNIFVIVGDTNVSTNLYNYFLILLDDYVQNHLNDGLVTITSRETSVSHGPFVNVCDPVTGQNVARPADYGSPGVTYTAQQLYSFNQQVQSQIVAAKSYSSGPFVKDIFGIIPVKTSGLSIGSVYVEFGGSLQNQQRLYFGPVNIHRMTIKLMNDRGNLVDLNKANWSFSFICEQLYKNSIS